MLWAFPLQRTMPSPSQTPKDDQLQSPLPHLWRPSQHNAQARSDPFRRALRYGYHLRSNLFRLGLSLLSNRCRFTSDRGQVFCIQPLRDKVWWTPSLWASTSTESIISNSRSSYTILTVACNIAAARMSTSSNLLVYKSVWHKPEIHCTTLWPREWTIRSRTAGSSVQKTKVCNRSGALQRKPSTCTTRSDHIRACRWERQWKKSKGWRHNFLGTHY